MGDGFAWLCYLAVKPPSIMMVWPVMYPEAALPRNTVNPFQRGRQNLALDKILKLPDGLQDRFVPLDFHRNAVGNVEIGIFSQVLDTVDQLAGHALGEQFGAFGSSRAAARRAAALSDNRFSLNSATPRFRWAR